MGIFDASDEEIRQFVATNTFVPALRGADMGPAMQFFKGIRVHQVGVGPPAGSFGDLEQLAVIDADFRLELHQRSFEPLFGSDLVDRFGKRR